jgi:Ca2+-binding EF-hand superfamily protein
MGGGNFLRSAAIIVLLGAGASVAAGQPADEGPGKTLDADREILKQIKEAYKAQYEVPEDVLQDLRKSYKQPSAQREASMIRDLRRLYLLSEAHEQAILREIHKAIEHPSAEQEARLFREIEKAERLPNGAVAPTIQASQAEKLFGKLDLNADGRLETTELTDSLRSERFRWDANRDGSIDLREFFAYYQGRLRWLADEVAAGRIDLGLKRGGPVIQIEDEDARPNVYRAGKLPRGLPSWFESLDFDKDGQIGLYEWRRAGKALNEFGALDRNDDGLITPEEALRYLAHNQNGNGFASAADRAMPFASKKGKKQP